MGEERCFPALPSGNKSHRSISGKEGGAVSAHGGGFPEASQVAVTLSQRQEVGSEGLSHAGGVGSVPARKDAPALLFP